MELRRQRLALDTTTHDESGNFRSLELVSDVSDDAIGICEQLLC